MKDSQDWLDEIFVDWATAHGMTGATGKIKFGLNKSDKQAKSAIRKHILQEVEQELEHFRPPSMLDEVMQLGHTSTHEYRGERYNSCALCGNCPGAMTKYIDDRLAELRNKFNDRYGE